MFVIFIFVTGTGSVLGCASSKPFYDGSEMSRIASIYDDFVKLLHRLTCDAQSMTLSKITYVFLKKNR
jgi:hypothetical protein